MKAFLVNFYRYLAIFSGHTGIKHTLLFREAYIGLRRSGHRSASPITYTDRLLGTLIRQFSFEFVHVSSSIFHTHIGSLSPSFTDTHTHPFLFCASSKATRFAHTHDRNVAAIKGAKTYFFVATKCLFCQKEMPQLR